MISKGIVKVTLLTCTCSASSRGGGVVVLCRVACLSGLHALGLAILGSQACRAQIH